MIGRIKLETTMSMTLAVVMVVGLIANLVIIVGATADAIRRHNYRWNQR